MKKQIIMKLLASTGLLAMATLAMVACNNNTKDATDVADSTNTANRKMADSTGMYAADAATSDFFVKAADGGMAEVALSQAAENQASDKRVKSLANMLVQDHTAANDKLKQLAAERNVTLPAAISTEHQNTINDITAKKGSAFDKAYVDHLVDAHKSTIDMFKKAADDVKDETVRNFINDMIPKLQGHLDKAEALQKALK